MAAYDEIGRTYSSTRIEDPRIAAPIHAALGDARRVLNVGAGTGNYEPNDRDVVALEPSEAMLGQRRGRTSAVVRGAAEHLPFRDGSFDATMCVLTLHHWRDLELGLRELQRVAPRQVVLFFEPLASHGFWALDYFPEALHAPTEVHAPGREEIAAVLDVTEVEEVLVPRDCTDGFGTAYWARPEAYLDPAVQAGMSWLALMPDDQRRAGTDRLRADLASGRWLERHGRILEQDRYDGGYRIAVAGR